MRTAMYDGGDTMAESASTQGSADTRRCTLCARPIASDEEPVFHLAGVLFAHDACLRQGPGFVVLAKGSGRPQGAFRRS